MATWKKVVVSGSNISQLNNDAGYLTAGTLGAKNAYSTASFNGTNLIAGSTTASLSFASSSGQGLNITANSGTNTLTFGLASIPNSSLANSTISGVALGSNLNALTAGSGLSAAGTYDGSTARTFSVDSASMAAYFATQSWAGVSGDITISSAGNAQIVAGTIVNADVNASAAIDYTKINFGGSSHVSASVLSSPNQGEALLTTNGVAGSTIDLGLQTSDSPTFVGLTLTGNLVVLGTASFQNTQNLLVGDRFVLFASGSNTTGDGGIVVQQGTQNIGELYGYDSGTTRWGFTSSFDATGNSFTPAVYAGAVETGAVAPTAAPKYGSTSAGQGTIYVDTNAGDIYIYV